MNTKSLKIGTVLILAFLVSSSAIWAQNQRPSPADSATGKIGEANVTIKYSSPSVKGRKIWGDLVPYDVAWRAGANQATTIITDKPLKIGGKELPAGSYTIFAIPGEKEWQIVFNSQVGQWGTKRTGEANYDPANNVATITVKPKKSADMNERLKYEVKNNGVVLKWENLEVPVVTR